MNVIAGRGGSTGLNYSATKLGGQGGVGGDASLEVSGAITANSVVVRSGSSRGDATLGDARGGAAKFLANSLSAPEIMIEKATGEVYFSVNSLKIDSDTRLYLINTSESANFGDPGVYIGEARIGDGVLAVESDNQGLGESGAYIGTLVLTGRGSFTETRLNDALSVSLGQLAIDGGVIGANNWDILGKDYANQDIELRSNGAVVYLLDGEELTIDRDLVGAGQLEKTGEGTLILSGNSNAYSGGTLISGGILKGDTLSVQGNIENNALLVFEQDFDGEFFSDISGQGSLTKSGLGTLTLSGVNTFNGLTTVQSGTLKLGADLSSSNLTLYGGATFDNSAGFTHSLDSGSLTVLVNNGQSAIYIGDLEAKNAQLRFYSTAFDPTTPLLKVMGDADISDSKFIIGLSGATVMAVGDTMTVMEVSDGQALKAENTLHRGFGEVLVGSTMFYEIAAEPEATLEEFYDDASLKLRSVMAVKATVVKGSVLDQTKALAEGWLGGLVQVQQGADLIAYQGINEAASLASAPGNAGFSAFSAVSGGSIRYNTGSHVDAKGLSLLVGLAWGTDLAPGRLTLGAFFEYGDGSYDTHNSFKNAADVDGEGDTRYAGGGVLGRFELNKSSLGSYYVEASGRAGGVRNEYKNSDLRNLAGRRAEFDTSTPYYGFHLGTGYIFSLTEATSLDVYGKYFWTSQEGESTRLSTGERLKFDDANSSRVRVGGRLSIAVNDHVAPYFGAAYEREFEGKAKATVNGFKIKEPSLRGDTGVGELGLSFKPSASVPLTLDLGAQGYVGKREGVTGSLKLKFTF
ncbi:MAG: autotransporter-associated beta strand repeat-containing protein [Deltaproteobacteria bacterium]|nr:autotransporter-associated beta strand repeat-containing protein [Deltaproteobacteria bacterium]